MEELKQLIEQVCGLLHDLTDEQRREVFEAMTADYCYECGRSLGSFSRCYCCQEDDDD